MGWGMGIHKKSVSNPRSPVYRQWCLKHNHEMLWADCLIVCWRPMRGGHRYNGQYTPPHWHMVTSHHSHPGVNAGTGPLLPVSCVVRPPQTCSLHQGVVSIPRHLVSIETITIKHKEHKADDWQENERTIEDPDCMQDLLVLIIPGPDNGAL